MEKINNKKNRGLLKKLVAIGFSFGLLFSSLIATSIFSSTKEIATEAADYAGGGSGFVHNADGSVKATFTVSNSSLNMRGWLLCLFDSKPSVDGNNKLNGSNDIHPYSYSACKHYFFVSSSTASGSITVTWAANAADQKTNWSSSATAGTSGNTLNDYLSGATNWHIVIGPRHYGNWGGSGIGSGTDNIWENCDYYIGESSTVIPPASTTKDMSVSVINYNGVYTGASRSITVNVSDPSSGYTIKYRTASSGSYNLSQKPTYTNAGNYTTYFQITASGYNTYTGSGTVKITKANPTYTAPTAKTNLVYNGSNQALLNAGSNVVYSLNNSSYSSSIPTGKDAGTYKVYYKVEETTNYKGTDPVSINVTIAKANPTYTAPTAKTNLVYNKENQALINAGSNVVYSLDNVSYSSSIPTGKDAGTYKIYYKVEETTNYKGVDPISFDVTIEKADAAYTAIPSANIGLKYNGESQVLVSPGSVSGGTIKYSLDNSNYSTSVPAETLVGNYTVYYKIEGDSNYNGTTSVSFVSVNISPNDKTALNDAINQSSEYVETIVDYPSVANKLNNAISEAEAVLYNDNKTVNEIAEAKEDIVYAYDLAHSEISDILIEAIGSVRLTDGCLEDIETAEAAYDALSEEQKSLVENHDALEAARNLYDKLEDVQDAIDMIGEVTYDAECLERINTAKEAYNSLSKDEQLLIPTLFNDLNKAEDIYDMLKIISELGEVEYSEEYLKTLEDARNAYDALDLNEQAEIYNYDQLVEAEEAYYKIDNIVNLVNAIDEVLEYVGTHNSDIDKAREAYEALGEEEKALVPQEVVDLLTTKEEEYEELKIEHERKEIEDREAGVVIATEGGSGIPNTVSIDINNSQNSDQNIIDNIDYQTINENIAENEEISSICEIKFYEEVDGEIVEVSLEDIAEDMTLVIKLDVPEEVASGEFKVVLLDEDNNIIEVEYTYDPETRQVTVHSNKVGTFAIVTVKEDAKVASEGLPLAIIGAVLVALLAGAAIYFLIIKKNKIG